MVTPAAGREVEVFGDFLLVQPIASSPMAEVTLAVRLGERSGRTYVIKRPRVGSGMLTQALARMIQAHGGQIIAVAPVSTDVAASICGAGAAGS